MLTICALTGGETYASRHLSSNDYYSEHERIVGQWRGRGAELLGLDGEVKLAQFEAIRLGLDPASGEFLRPRQSADRFNEKGERTSTARTLYDFTVSAPKSISIQSLVDSRLVEAHRAAVQEMAREMESLAATRVRQGGADENRPTGNLVIAQYQHDTSRELDPQLHSHLVAANLTYDGTEGRWKALQASEIYEQREYLTEVYRNALARSVREYGYAIQDRFDRGRERGFEIAEMPEALLTKFSQRSEQRDRAIADFVAQNGRQPTNGEVAVLVRESRTEKLAEISSAEVRARQWSRMEPLEKTRLHQIHTEARERGPIRERAPVAESLAYAREHLFERVSVAKDYQLQTEALRQARGRLHLEELKAEAFQVEARGLVVKAGREMATLESLARERAMVTTINQGQGRYARLGGTAKYVASDRLRPEQKHAVQVILESRDLAVNLRGAAGTGKTLTLQEVQRGVTEGGRSLVAIAPTRSAVEELQKVGFSEAQTVERLLQSPGDQDTLRGKVLLVDEAGMMSSRQMSELLALAERQGAQFIFSGDTRQIQSVEAGDALRVLETESRLRSVSLTQVQRQTLAEYRSAVEELRVNPERGFAQLEQMGAVREVEWSLRPQAVSQAYREITQQPNAQGQTRTVLVVAPTHEEIDRVTGALREDRKRVGELGEEQTFDRHVPLHWTAAQKGVMKNYRPGLHLEFHKATRHCKKDESVEVVRVERDHLVVRKKSGEDLTLTRRQTQAFSVYERQEIQIAAGDQLLLEANRRTKEFRATNGELVTVKGMEGNRIQLEDGRTLPGNYRQLNYGYAVTAHRSQGKTVDAVIVSGDRMPQELFYVAVTRGRESLTVVTSNKEQLCESIGISGQRTSAMELARQAEEKRSHLPELRRETGIEAAQHWALWQSIRNTAQEKQHVPEHQPQQERTFLPHIEVPLKEMAQEPERKQEQTREYGHSIGW